MNHEATMDGSLGASEHAGLTPAVENDWILGSERVFRAMCKVAASQIKKNIPEESLHSHRIHVYNVCYIWCSMDPMNKNPLFVSINIPAPWICHGIGSRFLKTSGPDMYPTWSFCWSHANGMTGDIW